MGATGEAGSTLGSTFELRGTGELSVGHDRAPQHVVPGPMQPDIRTPLGRWPLELVGAAVARRVEAVGGAVEPRARETAGRAAGAS